MATVVKNTDWETNGKKISAILDKALREDRAALNAAGEAAREMRSKSVEITHKVGEAAKAQKDASLAFHSAAERLLGVMEAHEQGKWRRMGMMALVVALTAALGLFGGYWWAKGNIQKARLAEVGELLRSSSGEDFCGDMSSTVIEADNNGVYCASWIKLPTE
jgi:type VI protein secretion system component VasK